MIGIYVRVSTAGQVGEDKYSLPQQKEDGIKFATSRNKEYTIYEDHKSGNDLTREGWTKLLEDAASGVIDTIWVGKTDRFSRNTVDGLTAINVMRTNKTRFFIGDIEYDIFNEETYLLITMQFAFAQYERMSIKKRTMAGKKRSRDEGNNRLNNTLGYENAWDQKGKPFITINEEEAETVRYIFKLYVEEKLTYNQMVFRLNSEGYKCKKRGVVFKYKGGKERMVGEKWSMGSFIQVLTRPEYIGKTWNSNKTELVDSNYYTPIVDVDIWNEAQRIKKLKRKSYTNSGYRITNHAVSGLMRCSECGTKYYFRDCSKGRGGKYIYYAHKDSSEAAKKCKVRPKLIDYKLIEDAFTVIYLNTFTDYDELQKLHMSQVQEIKTSQSELERDRTRLQNQISEIDQKIQNIVTVIESGVELDQLGQRIKALQKEKEQIKEYMIDKENSLKLKTEEYGKIYEQYTIESLTLFLSAKPEVKRDIYYSVFGDCFIDIQSNIHIVFKGGREVVFNIKKIPVWLAAQLDNYRNGVYTPEWINNRRVRV